MLEELHVRDLALIQEVWLEFGPGMTVLSGETGAGKTALVGALKLLIGGRADSSMVRAGATETLVEGRFSTEQGEALVRRRLTADGRSKCLVNGEMATVSELAARLGPVVDLHGQHDHQALLTPSAHAPYLDRYAGRDALDARTAYAQARAAYLDAKAELGRLEAEIADATRRSDYLRFVVSEITGIDSHPGEDEEIERRLPALKHADRLAEALSEALARLRGDGAAQDQVAETGTILGRVSGIDPKLDQLSSRFGEVETLLAEVSRELREYAEGIEHDPRTLDELQARQAALSDLKKKYGPTLADVLRTCEDAEAGLEAVQSGEMGLVSARERLSMTERELREAGEALVAVHAGVAPGFVKSLEAATADLEMPGVGFDVRIEVRPFEAWAEEGPHQLEFMYSPARDVPPRPLAKIASGGELSRVMLALKGVLGRADEIPILVFDEVDAGIGGAAAVAVGRRLRELAETHQVLVITHLAQVAAFADSHLVVDKGQEAGEVRTTVRRVEGEARVAEIARMLSGSDTPTSRAHAQELLGNPAAEHVADV